MGKNKSDNKEKKNLKRWALEGISTGLIAFAIVAVGLVAFLYFFNLSTQDSSPDIKKGAGRENFILESDLGECEKESAAHAKQACMEFVKKQCPTLKANYVLQEKKSIASQDLGYRLPALQQRNDPFYPTECIREWLLTLSEFVNLSGSPFLSHKSHANGEMSSHNNGKMAFDNPKTFSVFPDFKEFSPEYFAHKDDLGNLQFPEKYEIEKKYSLHDQKLLKRALHAAYKYADINVAIQDGYLAVPAYIISMGIHFMNPLLFDETVNIDEPEFLTYIKSQSNNSYALAQLGYIQIKNGEFKKFRYPLFETPEAQGHNHLLNVSYINERNWWRYAISTNDEPSQEKIFVFVGPTGRWTTMESTKALAMYNDMKAFWTQNTTRAVISDSLWMMHVAINLYNEEGLFVDTFPLVDAMGETGEIYSLFGKKFDLNDYVFQANK